MGHDLRARGEQLQGEGRGGREKGGGTTSRRWRNEQEATWKGHTVGSGGGGAAGQRGHSVTQDEGPGDWLRL